MQRSTPEPITSSDPRSLRRDEKKGYQETPKNGFRALRHQERRRREFRQNSRALRSAALQRARDALSEDPHEAEAQEKPATEGGAAPVAAVQAKRKRQKDYYSSLLTKYEWMIEMPEDLGPSWRVMARPEGKRCLVVAGRGKTISRLESGQVLHVFPSALPNGSQKTRRPASVFCMFDTVFNEAEEAYYIVDVLAWNGVHLCGADIDFRMKWTRTNFQGCPAAAPPSPTHRYQLRMCDLHVCDAQGISAALDAEFPMDGLMFLHQSAPYVMTSNPFVLRWKDFDCSQWAIDTDAAGVVQNEQHVVLAYCAGGELKTGDENSAVTLGRLPESLIQRFEGKLKAGLLLRFKVGPGGFMVNSEGCICGADLQLVGTVTNHIRKADRYSRIVFQWQLRTEQVVSVQDLVAKVSEGDAAAIQ